MPELHAVAGRAGLDHNKPVAAPRRAMEVAFSFAVLLITPVAVVLGQASPPMAGWLVALATPPIVLAVDALDKHLRARRRRVQ